MQDIDTQAQNKLSGEALALDQKFKREYIDLVCERVGGETLSCSDDFFAEMENLIKPGRGVFIDDKFTERGKWMDGWESRRSYGRSHRNETDHDYDWCILRLGVKGVIRGVDIDTNYFRGNAPQKVSVEVCNSQHQPDESTEWHTLLEPVEVKAHSQNLFEIEHQGSWTHVKLNMFPDGGIARFRVYGEADVNWQDFVTNELIDLAYIKNGAKALLVSDMFFSDKNNLIMPGRGKNMADGWETKRRRDPGPDWSIIKLATLGTVEKIIVDTCHFKGNFPDTFTLEGMVTNDDDFTNHNQEKNWLPIINQTPLFAHREHIYLKEIIPQNNEKFTHVRLSIFPDGGISRLRIFGKADQVGQG